MVSLVVGKERGKKKSGASCLENYLDERRGGELLFWRSWEGVLWTLLSTIKKRGRNGHFLFCGGGSISKGFVGARS